MICLLVAATAFEIAPFLEYHRKVALDKTNAEIDILITGIGLAATTYSLSKQIQIRRPGMIIQAGIGGCFDNNISLGSVVGIKQEVIGDQAVIEHGELKTMFDLGLVPKNHFPFSNGWLPNKSDILKKIKLKKVKGITTNEITTSRQKIRLYRDKFNPSVESLEGAALHYVCLMEKIPFLQIRSISNYIGERNKKKWRLEESIANLNKELIALLQSF